MRKRGIEHQIIEILVVLLLLSILLNTYMMVRRVEHFLEERNVITGEVAGTVSMVIQVCGDGTVHGNESCDGNDLNSQTCSTQGFTGGTLSCFGNCSGFNTSQCTEEDTAGPTVDLQYPMNNSNFTWKDIYFGYNATDAGTTIRECNLFLNGEEKKKTNQVNETVFQYFVVTGLDSGGYTWQINCTDNTANRYVGSSKVRRFNISINASDTDGDGIDDDMDYFIGTNTSINTTSLSNPLIYINHSNNFMQNFTGNMVVNITDNGVEVMSFTFNFGAATLNLSKMRFEMENSSMAFGLFEVGHLSLPAGVTKTVYLNKVNASITSVCIRDSADATITDITADCSGSDETFLNCDGSTKSGYSCSEVDGRFKITGLKHSSGKQQNQGSSGGGGQATQKGATAQRTIGQATPSPAPSPTVAQPSVPAAVRPSATPKPSAPAKSKLFDVEVSVIQKFKEVMPGEEVVGEIALFYLGEERLKKRIDIGVYYAILDEQQNIIAEKFETVGVETKTVFISKLNIPLTAKPGPYWLYARISVGKEIAEAFDTFAVIPKREPMLEMPRVYIPSGLLWGILLGIILFISIVVYEHAHLKRQIGEIKEKLTEQELLHLQMLKGGVTEKDLIKGFIRKERIEEKLQSYLEQRVKKGEKQKGGK